MTIRGGGDPALNPWLRSRCEEWARCLGALPPMRMTASLVPVRTHRPNTRLRRDLRACWRAPLGNCHRFAHCRRARPINVACRRARDRHVKGKSLRDGLRPPLTVTARGGQSNSGRDEEMVVRLVDKEMENHLNEADIIARQLFTWRREERERRGRRPMRTDSGRHSKCLQRFPLTDRAHCAC